MIGEKMLAITTNLDALNSQRLVARLKQDTTVAMERLSTGLRVAPAGHDPSGRALSNTYDAEVRGAQQLNRNLNDLLSLSRTAEAAVQKIEVRLQRMRELALRGMNDAVTEKERSALETELLQNLNEVDSIARHTEYNGRRLLDGSFSAALGVPDSSRSISLDIPSLRPYFLGSTGNLATSSVTSVSEATATLNNIDEALQTVQTTLVNLGSGMSRLSVRISTVGSSEENHSASRSRIRDADFLRETAILAKSQILEQVSTAVLAQANTSKAVALELLDLG